MKTNINHESKMHFEKPQPLIQFSDKTLQTFNQFAKVFLWKLSQKCPTYSDKQALPVQKIMPCWFGVICPGIGGAKNYNFFYNLAGREAIGFEEIDVEETTNWNQTSVWSLHQFDRKQTISPRKERERAREWGRERESEALSKSAESQLAREPVHKEGFIFLQIALSVSIVRGEMSEN